MLSRVESIARDVVAPQVAHVDAGNWPEASLRALQKAGLGGLVVPERFGGLGMGMGALAQVCELLGTYCPSTGLCFGMHAVGSAVISAKATSHHQRQYLAPICEGTHLTTLALSEPGTGAHFYLPQTELTRVPGGYQLRGQKSFVTNGGRADSYVVSTLAAEPTAGPGDFSCLVVPASAQRLEWGPEWKGIGMRGNSSRTLQLQDVVVPRESLLGQEGDEIWYVFNVVAPYFLVAMAGTYLGIADTALRVVRTHLSRRQYAHTGRTTAQHPLLQHRFGQLWSKVHRTRLLVHDAAARGDAAHRDALSALCAAKAEVAEVVVEVVNEAMTLVGGKGYSEDGSPLFRLLRDARASHVMAPTTDILYTWVGRSQLGLPLLGD